MKRTVTKAIFPVAGLGTRFLPATKSVPKEIMTLVDRPLIQYAIDEARAAGIKEFIFVTSRGKSALEDYFDDSPILEQELRKKKKLDLGGAQAYDDGLGANRLYSAASRKRTGPCRGLRAPDDPQRTLCRDPAR